MRKLKLFMVACALMVGAQTSWGTDWTDKTSVITNPSFETDVAIADLTNSANRAVPTGWSITYDTGASNNGTQQWGTANSTSNIYSKDGTGNFNPSDGDKFFHLRENWHAFTYELYQTIPAENLPAGFYKLTAKMATSASAATDYTLSIQEEGGTAVVTKQNTGNNAYAWQEWSAMVYKSSGSTTLTIKATMKGGSSKNSHWCMLLDDFKLEYAAQGSISTSNTLDMTSWIVNPSFELNTFNGTQADGSSIGSNGGTINKPTGYTCYFNVDGWRDCSANTTAPADGTYCMNSWFGTINEQKFYQTIDYLPEGVYEISAQVRTDQTSTEGIYTYGIAGGETYKSASWDASMMAGTWNSMENWQTLTARASVIGGGSLQFGLRSDKFVQFDDFHLTYLGSDLLLAELKSSFSTKQTTANGLLGNSDYDNVIGTERATLTTKKGVTPDETVAGWTTAVNELQNAIDAFTAAKTNYDALVAEIAKAKALGIADATADGYAATSSSTAASALTNTQNLKVAEYNYVTSTYAYGVDLGAWTTTGYTSDNSGQHWDGTNASKYKEQENSWGTPKKGYAADSWSIAFEQTISLPAGNYVFKVAGRKASGNKVTMSLDVTNVTDKSALGSVNDFPEGDTGLGINTSGATDFTTGEGHTYANDGAGRGWEWRYVKFTLTGTKDVKIAVNAEATATSQWISFCNYTLQTDDNTNISLIAYNIALNSAQTIIADGTYSNVTGSEKTDLQDAINADGSLDKSDKDAIDAATATLDAAREAFINAKSAYDAFVAAKAVVYEDNLPYASSTKFDAIGTAQEATATSASDATSKTDAIISAYRKYVESNAMGEGVSAEDKTSLISDPDMDVTYDSEKHTFGAWQVFNQVDGTISLKTTSDQPLTDGDGNKYKYADIWKADNNGGIKQTIKLPAGKYLLTVAGRAQNVDGATFVLFAGDKNTPITRMGDTGGVFGNGWNDASLMFYVHETADVEIGVVSGNGKTMWWGATRFRLARLGDAIENITVSDAGFATYVSDNDLDYSDVTGLKAYKATVSGNTITFETVNTVPAGEGVLLRGDGGIYSVPVTAGVAAWGAEDNAFIRGTGAAVETGSGPYNYILNKVNGVIGFYRANGQTVATNRAYLQTTTNAARLNISFDDDDQTTGIARVEETVANDAVYTLSGVRVEKPTKGLYIKNGKKVVIK